MRVCSVGHLASSAHTCVQALAGGFRDGVTCSVVVAGDGWWLFVDGGAPRKCLQLCLVLRSLVLVLSVSWLC